MSGRGAVVSLMLLAACGGSDTDARDPAEAGRRQGEQVAVRSWEGARWHDLAPNDTSARRTLGAMEMRVELPEFGPRVAAWVAPEVGDWLPVPSDGRVVVPSSMQSMSARVLAERHEPVSISGGEWPASVAPRPLCSSTVRVKGLSAEDRRTTLLRWERLEDETLPRHRRPGVARSVRFQEFLGPGEREVWETAERLAVWLSRDGAGSERGSRRVLVPPCAFAELDARQAPVATRLNLRAIGGVGPAPPPRLHVTCPADRFDVPQEFRNVHPKRDGAGSGGEQRYAYLEPRCGPLIVELRDSFASLPSRLPDGWQRLDAKRALWTGGEVDSAELPIEPGPPYFEMRTESGEQDFLHSLRFAVIGAERPRGVVADLERGELLQAMLWSPPMTAEFARSSDAQIVLWAEGRKPARVDLPLADDTRNVRLVLEPATPRGLRVLDAGGSPIDLALHPLAVQESLPYETTAGSLGAHPILPWIGGDVALRAHPATLGLPGDALVELAELDADWLADHEFTELVIPIEWGRVTVRGAAGRTADLVLVDAAGFEHRPDRRDADRVHFDGVPPGVFFVGPADVARQRARFADRGAARTLAAGESVAVEWEDAWSLDARLEGRVEVASLDCPTPFLMPCYLDTPDALELDRDDPWISVDDEGRYSVPRGRPLPTSMLVCSLAPPLGEVVVHEVVAPGVDLVRDR